MFALAAIALFLTSADQLTLNVDEGIYLDGALRVMNGQAPYRDFVMVHGPGSPWLYGGVFRLFGVSLKVARLPLALFGGLKKRENLDRFIRADGRLAGLEELADLNRH